MGWRPSTAPLGYINRAFGGVKDIIIDVERASFVKQAFEKAAYMYASGRTIKTWLDEQGFVTRNNKKIALSAVYSMLKNPFYYGHFEFPIGSGKWYKGLHEPIITKELFEDAQKELGKPRVIKWGNKEFPFKGIFTCYSCGSGVVGEEKFRSLKAGGKRRHIYYHCSRSKNHQCNEPYLDEKDLIKHISDLVDSMNEKMIKIPEKLRGALIEYQNLVRDTLFINTEKMQENIDVGIKDYVK